MGQLASEEELRGLHAQVLKWPDTPSRLKAIGLLENYIRQRAREEVTSEDPSHSA